MNCKEAYGNLLGSEAPAAPTAEVAQHLAQCPACQKRQRRLVRMERELADLPRPGESPEARLRLLEQIQAPAPAAAIIPLPELRPLRSSRRGMVALIGVAAAVLVLVVGLAAWLGPGPRHDEPIAKETSPEPAGPADELVASLLDSDLKLARLTTAPEQVETLVDMAGRLQNEAIRLARQGQVDEVAWLRDLHEQVVIRGLAARATMLSEAQRQQVARLLVEKAEQSLTAAESLDAGVGRHLQAMTTVSLNASESLLANRRPEPLPLGHVAGGQPASRGLLNALVLNGIRLAEEDDPLRRADYCTDIADSLLLSILAASAAGNTGAATALGQRLDDVMDRGVAANLSLVEASQPSLQQQAELERVRNRTEASLDRAIQQAPPGLQKALEVSKGKAKGKGKGKGSVPPGHLKKKEKPERGGDD